jgi:DNA-binding MarR family transcriptional regulator
MKIEEEIKQSKFRDPLQKVAINLLFTANWLFAKQQEFFKPFGITSQQFNILRILRGQGDKAISGVEIKSRMLDKNSDIPRLLERLIKKNLISKVPSKSDKRAADVKITNEGLALLKQIDATFDENEKNVLALSHEEAQQLSALLDKVRG